jgi:uncharacterized repeat protein (TIGR03847 family)
MTESFDLGDVAGFTTGTVGPPGQRTFFLQFLADGRAVSLRLEKQQVAALAQYLGELMNDLEPPPPAAIVPAPTLDEPVQAAWTVGSLGVAFQPELDRILFLAEELVITEDDLDDDDDDLLDLLDDLGDEDDDDDDDDDDDLFDLDSEHNTLRAQLTRAQVAAFISRAADTVAAGRRPCRFCGRPLDGDGTWCPCYN